MLLAERQFALSDQLRFAALSGDCNPLHVDAAWAADVFPGQLVVHGMHVLLWALNEHLQERPGEGLAELSVTFHKPIFLHETVRLERSQDGSVLTVRLRDVEVLVARLRSSSAKGPGPALPASGALASAPRELELERIVDTSGTVHLPATEPLLRDFGRVVAALGGAATRGLAGLSTLVGMVCPGLRSIFSGFAVTFPGESSSLPLVYRVVSTDKRFGLVTMAVESTGLTGTVSAFAGRRETEIDDAELVRLVKKGEFAGQRPLIVGGSRGLGSVTALLLAAGGARPLVTFRSSESSAQEVRQRIANLGESCDLVRFDVASPANSLETVGALSSIEQAYYFATPRIFRRRLEPYQATDHADFTRIYVDGFYEMIRTLMKGRKGSPLRVFYPSTVAVTDPTPDLFEYALAKQSGEQLSAWLEKKYKGLKVSIERLPRIETAQTLAVVKVPAEKAHQAMLPIIRRVQEGIL